MNHSHTPLLEVVVEVEVEVEVEVGRWRWVGHLKGSRIWCAGEIRRRASWAWERNRERVLFKTAYPPSAVPCTVMSSPLTFPYYPLLLPFPILAWSAPSCTALPSLHHFPLILCLPLRFPLHPTPLLCTQRSDLRSRQASLSDNDLSGSASVPVPVMVNKWE